MKPWYHKGLHFECTGCGKCCTGSPGYVWLNIAEMEAIAKFLKIPFDEFTQKFVKKVKDRYSLIEANKNFDCVFFKENRCTIYPVRPKQCRTYPFWDETLKSQKSWDEEKIRCEGINDQSTWIPLEKITKSIQ